MLYAVIPILLAIQAPETSVESPRKKPAAPCTVNFTDQQSLMGTALGAGQTFESAGARAEIVLSQVAVIRLDAGAAVRVDSVSSSSCAATLLRGKAFVELLTDDKEHPVRIVVNNEPITMAYQGLYVLDASAETAAVMKGKLRVARTGQGETLKSGKQIQLIAAASAEKLDRKALSDSDFYRWARGRSQYLASLSWPTAQTIVKESRPWYGAGWYWNRRERTYTFLPRDGEVTDAFGCTYRSPWEEYAPLRPMFAD